MLFNSVDFIIFLPIVFFLYWFGFNKNLTIQNVFIIAASYIFYSFWDWRFLFLIFFSTLTDYLAGIGISKLKDKTKQRIILCISLVINISILGFFKYYNFFVDSFVSVFTFLGAKIESRHLMIILPVGISFYTFQTMSYSIDVYNKKIEATKDFAAFAAYVSFFPQLVAGPIERANNFLIQFFTKRTFCYNQAVDGCKQILWGFFKKIVIADSCAMYANNIFNNYTQYSGIVLILGAFFFAIQIYGDFSGYSDIAIGVSKLFGFTLIRNFSFPYFSRDIAEFWRRWHISLTTWFRDYVYIPLGGSRGGKLKSIRNTFIVFLLSGFWHGAEKKYLVWGLVNALYFLPLLLTKNNRKYLDTVASGKTLPSVREFAAMIMTFCMVSFAWIFFRSSSIKGSFNYISRIFTGDFINLSGLIINKETFLRIGMVIFFFIMEWLGRESRYAIENIHVNKYTRWFLYYCIFGSVIFFSGTSQEFIYFQF
jgi:D-alanyl-lipoteichoic acid acyltransferase DltB (MBOAT superfamily)